MSDEQSNEPKYETPYSASHQQAPPAAGASFPCAYCGYNLAGVTLGQACPECGNVMSNHPSQTNLGSGTAVTSLVLGIVSIVGCMLYGVLSVTCGPLAIYFGMKAHRLIREGKTNPNSRGMATAGKICGIIGTCIGGLYFLFMIVLVVGLTMSGGALGP